MRIPVEGIPDTGREVPIAMHMPWAKEAVVRSMEIAPEVLVGTMMLNVASRKAGLVRVELQVKVAAPADCDRCGEACRVEVDDTFTLLFAPEESGGAAFDGEKIELSVDDLDLGWYRNGEIQAGDVLREAIALALPTRVVCADTPECDKRTSALLAGQSVGVGHPAFEALKAFNVGSDDA